MNNDEIQARMSSIFRDLKNGTISIAESKKLMKEPNAALIQLQKSYKNFKRCEKIAKRRNETIVAYKVDTVTFYGIPSSSKEFYFESGVEADGAFNIDGNNYLIIYKDED